MKLKKFKVGVVGSGGIGMASAVWMSARGHDVSIWSPRGSADALMHQPITTTGALEGRFQVGLAADACAIAAHADVILITLPANGHRMAMDALLPHLRSGQWVIVSSMAALSSLYLYERSIERGVQIQVASFGTTALTARRKSQTEVAIMTRRRSVAVSTLPRTASHEAQSVCEQLFGAGFEMEDNPLVSTLANTNAIAHAPLALFNWTRIELAEAWPQYYFMTPHVASVIEKLDAERRAVAQAFGIEVRGIEQHFRQSFKVDQDGLADIAAELHKRRGGPPGPTEIDTRFLSEDIPYGLVFINVLARIAGIDAPVTEATIQMSGFLLNQNFAVGNDLIEPLGLASETVPGLLTRVGACQQRE